MKTKTTSKKILKKSIKSKKSDTEIEIKSAKPNEIPNEQDRAMNSKPEVPIVFAKCRRGSDVQTNGQSCNSKRVYKLTPDGSSLVQFKCVECGHVWSVPLGGTINI
jgi:hypothetical protein